MQSTRRGMSFDLAPRSLPANISKLFCYSLFVVDVFEFRQNRRNQLLLRRHGAANLHFEVDA